MKILIAGATGSIGLHVVNIAFEMGHQPVALVRNKRKAKLLPDNQSQPAAAERGRADSEMAATGSFLFFLVALGQRLVRPVSYI